MTDHAYGDPTHAIGTAQRVALLTDASALTPGRSSTLLLDVPESVLSEQGCNIARTGAEIAKRASEGNANDSEHAGMRFWSSGCWTTQFLQADPANLHESTDGAAHVLGAAAWLFTVVSNATGTQSLFEEVKNFAQSTVTGASYSGTVPATGDIFLKKRVPSVGSADPGALPANSGFDSARPAITLPNTDVPMDRVAVSASTYRHNQGFFLRWKSPGTTLDPLRYQWIFHFGQYAITLKGSGSCELWEYCQNAAMTYRWIRRKSWRFTQEANGAAGNAQSMAIFPHQHPDGTRYISFVNQVTASAARVNTSQRADVTNASTGEEVYRIDQAIRGSDIDASPGYVTSVEKIRFDVRRDLFPHLQVSTLAFDDFGTLIDDPGLNGGGVYTANTATPVMGGTVWLPAGCSITGQVIDGQTQVAFVPGTDLFPAGKFSFVGASDDSPILWAYSIKQAPVIVTSTPGQFSVPCKNFAIDGYAGDPSQETARATGFDPTMTHTRLTKRGRFSAVLQTTYTPPSADPVIINLFHGVCRKPRSVRKGTPRGVTGGWASDWREYSFLINGMWDRLNERVQGPQMRIYGQDPAATPGTLLPWKVTDVVKDLLGAAGFSASQMSIPNLSYRLWPGYSDKNDGMAVNPGANIAELLVRLLRERLGAFLVFEPNSGAFGQWRIIFGTQPGGGGTFTPVYNFVSDYAASGDSWSSDPGGGHLLMPYHPASYADNTTFIKTEPDYVVNPPDYNVIELWVPMPVTSAQTQMLVPVHAYNFLSYQVPGSSVTPDPNHPDFIGHPVIYKSIGAHFVVPGDIAATRAAAAWGCRRLYDFLCHAQRIVHFRAPLVFIQDTSLSDTVASSSGNWRPLRFQDPVSIDGDPTWLIKSIHPSWSSDRAQMAEYECIQPFPGQFFYGWDGHEEKRRATRRMSQRTVGMASHSGQFGMTAPAPHRDAPIMELPVIRRSFGTLQDPSTGAFTPMPGWNTWDGSDG